MKKLCFILIMCFNFCFAQKINVMSLGAKGDGISDDTSIIQKALDVNERRGGGIVIIPTAKSDYLISETLFIGSNTKLEFGNSFLKLTKYTKIGTVLVNKNGATNIQIINPKIDANNIFAGGTGENGISFGDGGTCYVEGGIIKNCRSGTTHHRLGGKGLQVEDANVGMFRAIGTKIENCEIALSSNYDISANIIKKSKINVIYDRIVAKDCAIFLFVTQANGFEESSNHNVLVKNFNAINCGQKEGVIVLSRAKGLVISNGTINGNKKSEAVIRGRHSFLKMDGITVNQPTSSVLNLKPSFHAQATTKSFQNNYNLKIRNFFDILLISSAGEEYSFRELFDSNLNAEINNNSHGELLMAQAISKSSTINIRIMTNGKIKKEITGNMFDLYINKELSIE